MAEGIKLFLKFYFGVMAALLLIGSLVMGMVMSTLKLTALLDPLLFPSSGFLVVICIILPLVGMAGVLVIDKYFG